MLYIHVHIQYINVHSQRQKKMLFFMSCKLLKTFNANFGCVYIYNFMRKLKRRDMENTLLTNYGLKEVTHNV